MDVTPPSITCPATLTLGCNATVPAADVTLVTATDACGTPTVTFVNDVTNLVNCTETTTRTYRAVMLVVTLLSAHKLLQELWM